MNDRDRVLKLRATRQAAGIAQTLLAHKAKIDRIVLCHIERGYDDPGLDDLANLELALDDLIRLKIAELQRLLKRTTITPTEAGVPGKF